MTRPLAQDLLDRVRKALESVPCAECHLDLSEHKGEPEPMDDCLFTPDYHALTAKVAPLVEALEFHPSCGACSEALAPWRTEGSP